MRECVAVCTAQHDVVGAAILFCGRPLRARAESPFDPDQSRLREGTGAVSDPRNVAHAELLVLAYMLRCYKTARNVFAEVEDPSLLVVRSCRTCAAVTRMVLMLLLLVLGGVFIVSGQRPVPVPGEEHGPHPQVPVHLRV